jgi:hypothetical protein
LKLLERLRARTSAYPVLVRAMVVGDAIDISGERQQRQTIQLERLATVPTTCLRWTGPRQDARRISANTLRSGCAVHIKAQRPGCAVQGALHLGREAGSAARRRPAHPGGETQRARGALLSDDLPALEAGLRSTLSVWKAPGLDAAFHVFEFELEGAKRRRSTYNAGTHSRLALARP